METRGQEADTPLQSTADSIQELSQDILKNAVQVTKCSNELPNSGLDWDYFCSFPAFSNSMNHFSSRITQMMTKIYQHYDLNGKVHKLDLEEQVEMVSDSNDVLMERINNTLDEAAGIKKQVETVVVEVAAKSVISGSWNKVGKHLPGSPTATYRLLSAKNILRPQLKFKEKISNKPVPFVPKIKEKPHSVKPLAILLEINDFGDEEYSHPYEFELERFKPSDEFLRAGTSEIESFKKVEETSLVMVDTEDGLKALLADLCAQKEIAVDLEAHSYRTFQGITCLMQISTATKDYIVDTLELWDNLQCLNEVFCDPKILKIFHGADKDVEWLQRDFGLYLVNLFDTYQAAKLLNFPHLSLAYLLRHYCHVVVNKEFQLADWRIRPLPQEMINYAREDTHYLIYVHRRMKKDLLDRSIGNNLLVATWENSRQTCLKRYNIQKIGPDSHLELYRQSKKVFNNRQMHALKELFYWRDKVAREEDESVGFVLPKHMMLRIAEVLPREMQGILACCNPIPTLVRQHLLALHNIILKAREMPLAPLLESGGALTLPKPVLPLAHDTEDPLHCVHDLTHSQDIRDDLPTLLGSSSAPSGYSRVSSTGSAGCMNVNYKDLPDVRLFKKPSTDVDPLPSLAVTFVTPYQRYTRTKAMEQAAIRVELKERQDRVDKIHQHFMSVVNSSAVDDESIEGQEKQVDDDRPSETATSAESEAKKDKRASKNLPLSKQLPSKKRKKRNKTAGIPSDGQWNKPENEGAANDSETIGTPATSQKQKAGPTKKKVRPETAQSTTDAPEDSEASFTAFDYSQVDFQNFQRPRAQKQLMRGKRNGRGRKLSNKMMRNNGARSITYKSKNQ